MIDGSEKHNRQLAFELQNLHVCEKQLQFLAKTLKNAKSLFSCLKSSASGKIPDYHCNLASVAGVERGYCNWELCGYCNWVFITSWYWELAVSVILYSIIKNNGIDPLNSIIIRKISLEEFHLFFTFVQVKVQVIQSFCMWTIELGLFQCCWVINETIKKENTQVLNYVYLTKKNFIFCHNNRLIISHN